MDASILAKAITDKIADEFSIVEFSQFCDERGDIDFVPRKDIAKIIEEVIVSCCGGDLR